VTANEFEIKPRRHYRPTFGGSDRLFAACWQTYRIMLQESIDYPQDDEAVIEWLDTIAADKVNDDTSSFWMYGE
jgi:hypothetical protein